MAWGLCFQANIWCLLAYSENPPEPLKAQVACGPASEHTVCRLATGLKTHTHGVYFLIKIIGPGCRFIVLFLKKHWFLFFQQRCFNPQHMETQRTYSCRAHRPSDFLLWCLPLMDTVSKYMFCSKCLVCFNSAAECLKVWNPTFSLLTHITSRDQTRGTTTKPQYTS